MEPPVKHLQFPLLDSMRALAAISILVVHTAIFTDSFDDPVYGRLLAHLDIGVPFFFLLSAFLLYRPFVAARIEGTREVRIPDYARRRFLRIAPAYWLALTIAALIPGMTGALSGNWWVYYGLLQNFPIYTPTGVCATEPLRCGIPPAWSLAIEVAFYVVLPLYALAMAWVGKRWQGRWIVPEVLALLGISAVSVVIQSIPPITDLRLWVFFSPFGRGWWFALGMALAVLSVRLGRRESEHPAVTWLGHHPSAPIALGVALYAGAAGLILGPTPSLAFPVSGQTENVFQFLLFGAIAALVLLPAIFGAAGGGAPRRILALPGLSWLGLISYGIFLWQFPVLIVLYDAGIVDVLPAAAFPILTIATLALTIVCAALSYYLVERPLMRFGRRSSRA